MIERRATWWAALVVVAYLAITLGTLRQYGLTDDDDFYVPAGASYAEWLGKALRFQNGAFSRATIDKHFEPNHEHPPVAKYVFGITYYVFRSWLGPTDAARVGTGLFSAGIVVCWFILAFHHLGRRRGLYVGTLAAVFLLLTPRFFFHSHAATLDVPVASMYVVAATLALLAERSAKAGFWVGPVFGLALATKLNAPFLLVPQVLFAALIRWGAPRQPGRGFQLPPIPVYLLWMLVAGPLVFWLVWPWLWFDTIARLGAYFGFHLNHYGIYFLYFGQVFHAKPFAPWHAPFVMAAITTPLAISALSITGVAYGLKLVRARLKDRFGFDSELRREGDLLLFTMLHAPFAILVVALSGGAKYGGEKLFAPFFPFWCLLAAYGALRISESLQTVGKAVWARAVTGLAVASCLGLLLRFGPYALSEYNALTGGLRGATATGFERQYYDVAFRDLVQWLNQNAPQGARVHFLPNNWEYVRTYKWYRESGALRPDIQVVNVEQQAQWVVLTHERRFARYGEDLARYRQARVLLEKRLDGVPIWSVLEPGR